jgi:hypothetical protein
VIEQVYPLGYDPGRADRPVTELPAASPADAVVPAGRSGVVMAFSAADLLRRPRDAGVVVTLVPQVGDFVAASDPLFRVSAGTRPPGSSGEPS